MARDLTSGFITEINANLLRPANLVITYFDSGTTYNWTGVGNITWDGFTFEGLGDFLAFGDMDETKDIEARGTTVSLSGIKSSLISIALQEQYQGRRMEIYFAVLDQNFAVVPDPYLIFSGFMDVMEISDSGEESTISVSVENELIILNQATERTYTAEDQKIKYPNDKGLDQIPQLQDKEIIWKEKI